VVTDISDEHIASFFRVRDRSSIFLRNVCNYLQDSTVSQPIRPTTSTLKMEAIHSFENVAIYKSTRLYNSEDQHLQPWRWRRFIPSKTLVTIYKSTRLYNPEDQHLQPWCLRWMLETAYNCTASKHIRKHLEPWMWRLHVTQKKSVTIYNCTQSHNPEDQEGPGVQLLARRPAILTVVFEVFLSHSIQCPANILN
jgi:hypothetical protein